MAGVSLEIGFEDCKCPRQIRRSLDAGRDQRPFVGPGLPEYGERVWYSPVAIQDVPVLACAVIDGVLLIFKEEDRVAGDRVARLGCKLSLPRTVCRPRHRNLRGIKPSHVL